MYDVNSIITQPLEWKWSCFKSVSFISTNGYIIRSRIWEIDGISPQVCKLVFCCCGEHIEIVPQGFITTCAIFRCLSTTFWPEISLRSSTSQVVFDGKFCSVGEVIYFFFFVVLLIPGMKPSLGFPPLCMRSISYMIFTQIFFLKKSHAVLKMLRCPYCLLPVFETSANFWFSSTIFLLAIP